MCIRDRSCLFLNYLSSFIAEYVFLLKLSRIKLSTIPRSATLATSTHVSYTLQLGQLSGKVSSWRQTADYETQSQDGQLLCHWSFPPQSSRLANLLRIVSHERIPTKHLQSCLTTGMAYTWRTAANGRTFAPSCSYGSVQYRRPTQWTKTNHASWLAVSKFTYVTSQLLRNSTSEPQASYPY